MSEQNAEYVRLRKVLPWLTDEGFQEYWDRLTADDIDRDIADAQIDCSGAPE